MILLILNLLALFSIIIAVSIIYNICSNLNIKRVLETGSKIKNFSYVCKINYYILEIMNSKTKKFKLLSPLLILAISVFLSILTFVISFSFFKIFTTSVLISIFFFFLPYFILKYILQYEKQKIKNVFPTYAITLKNYTQVNNDIIVAFKKAKAEKPLSVFIDRFNIEVEKGISVYNAFEKLKSDINIKKIADFISATQVCYTKGGDFTKLIDRYSKILNKDNIQKEKEKQERFSSVVVLCILIFINIYLMIAFVFSNAEFKNILLTTFSGKVILNINIISYFVIFMFIQKINKMEE